MECWNHAYHGSTKYMNGVVTVCKPCGLTPLETLRLYVAQRGGDASLRRSYAGRLDPMAEGDEKQATCAQTNASFLALAGLLLVLEGDRCDEQESWQHHEKCYEWELLLGLSSDSFDVLGLGQAVQDMV